jgi:predicted secreted hydrolase
VIIMRWPQRLLGIIAALAVTTSAGAAPAWKSASPDRPLRFPADHASHPDYKTEWWYYTGHLTTESGKRYGYQLTFFRQGVDGQTKTSNKWQPGHLHMAHFAVSDLAGKRFRYAERMNRPGLGIAGAETDRYRSWNDDWVAEDLGGTHHLSARDGGMALDLLLDSAKPPVLHGNKGYSRKGACDSCASHYYSLTRLKSRGWLTVDGRQERVTGMSWMDHEFGSGVLEADQAGWDWYSLQLSDGTDLMLFRVRRKDGTAVPQSSGTFVAVNGSSTALSRDQVTIRPTAEWRSEASKAVYPMGWTIAVPSQQLQLTVTPAFREQELRTGKSTGVTYWEGAVGVSGTRNGKPVSGQGYIEMTGYSPTDKPRF